MSDSISIPFGDGELIADRLRVEHLRGYYRPQLEGYIYVIEFSSGTVKVGKAKDVAKRLGQHAKDARNHGITIVRSWRSPVHTSRNENEQRLIAFCWEHFGHPVSGEEYFASADFDVIVQFAAMLSFPTLRPEDLDRRVAEYVYGEQASERDLVAQQRRNRVEAGLPADPAESQASLDWFDSLTDEEAEEIGAAIRRRMARQDWLERKAERNRMREIEAQLAVGR